MSGIPEKQMSEGVLSVNPITGIERKKRLAVNSRRWRAAHSEEFKKAQKKYREENREKRREACKKWRIEHPDRQALAKKKWRENNRVREKETAQKWKEGNNEKVCQYRKNHWAKIRLTPEGMLMCRIRSGIRSSLKKGKEGYCWESLVGFTVGQFKKHIERLFSKGMNWELLIEGKIQIDHKIPIAAFNFETPNDLDFKKCWALKNLQPLWASENMSKQAKLKKPHQPSLAIEV